MVYSPYSHLTDKQLNLFIKNLSDKISINKLLRTKKAIDDRKNYLHALREKDNRLRRANMTISRLIN